MTTHIMSFTYEPKIAAVQNGMIRQTIRKCREGREINPGDFILFHGWEGRPYRSKWSWRKRVKVTEILRAYFGESEFVPVYPEIPYFIKTGPTLHKWSIGAAWDWDCPIADKIADLDGIDPPTGEALKKVLKKLNGKEWEGYYEIIRWEPVEEVY